MMKSKDNAADELDMPLRRTRNRRSKSDGVPKVHGAEIHSIEGTNLPSVIEDSPVLEPPSPGTPPKKLWERQFGSFRRSKGSKGDLPIATSSSNGIRPKKLPSPFSSDRRLISSANGGPTLPPISSEQEKSSEGSVRGGKLFANMFRGNSDHGSSTPTQARRVKSFSHNDELDGTMRRGSEKSHSPGLRHRKEAPPVPFLKPSKSGSHWIPPSPFVGMARAAKSAPTTLNFPLASPQNFAISSAYLRNDLAVSLPVNLSPSANTASTDTNPSTPSRSTPPSLRDMVEISSSSAMKKAFTEFHNSSHTGHDAVSAYLGDEPSGRTHSLAWTQNHSHLADVAEHGPSMSMAVSHGHLSSMTEHSTMESLHDNVSIFKSMRMLKAVQGVESWKDGRRYLIAPAALAASPLSVVTTLSGSNVPIPAPVAVKMNTAFGSILLGDCLLTYSTGNNATSVVQHWSTATLVLRQNYLLEYSQDSKIQTGIPRGYAHLQQAECKEHAYFSDALELHFYGSPCAKSDKRILMIRLMKREERSAWNTCLNRAAGLSIRDLYDYNAENQLGSGQYASVYPARRRTGNSKQETECPHTCALKIFDKSKFWRVVVKGRERSDTIVRETSVQATLTAKCGRILSILRICGFFETSEHVVLELELLEGTDLFKHISSKGTLSEKEAAAILRDVLQGLEAMNRIGIAHRDVKPANVLMCQRQRHGSFVKVCDFGMATFVGVDGQVRGRCGTPGYVAPEIFTAGLHGGYGNKVDVFSAGVTLYVMLCGYEPFYGETDDELVEANKQADVEFPEDEWDKISKPARDLVKKMMQRSPLDRPSAKDALKHPWFASVLTESDALDQSMSLPPSDAPEDDACVIS